MKIRNIFGMALAATLFFGSCTQEQDMTKVDQWLGEKFNQEILWDVDSLAFRRTNWESQDLAGGIQLRKSSIKMWETVQSISYINYSPLFFSTYLGYTGSEATVGDIAGTYSNALFAVNAGSLTSGKPSNFFKYNNEVVNATVSTDAQAMFGLTTQKIGDDITIINTKLTSNVEDHDAFNSAMVTGPVLVRDSEAVTEFPAGEFYDTRMARTIIGVATSGNCVIAVIDGGVAGKADGVTVKEAAFIAQLMGLKTAALLGCGAETTAWASEAGVVNNPSEGSAKKVGSIIYIGPGSVSVKGDGSQGNPYLIENYVHMMLMRTFSPANSTTYFRLENDIDMSEVKLWTPVNYNDNFTRQIHFDGNNKTITNFMPDSFVADDQVSAADYPSIFGVLYGSCKNLTIRNAKVIKDKDYGTACGVLGGFVGTGGKEATVENVHIYNAFVQGKSDLAIFGGQSRDASYKNCSAQGTIVIGNMANSGGNGGIIGRAAGKVSLENCHADVHISASVDPGKSFRTGALVGYAATIGGSDLTRDKLVIKQCSGAGTLFNDKYGPQCAGGLVGYMGMPEFEMTESYSTMNFEGGRTSATGAGGNTTCCGGLVGILSTANTASIKNCYSTAEKPFVVGQKSSGLIGVVEKGTVKVENCYTDYTINGYSGLGGLIGTSNAAAIVEYTNCLVWCPSIIAFRDAGDKYSSGALAGCVLGTSTFSNCFRNPALTFADPFRTMKEHADLAAGKPANDNEGGANTAGSANQNAFDGMPSEDATLNAAAQNAKWSTSVWDFSGAKPVLKWAK